MLGRKGLSLIEVGLVIVILSMVLAPIVANIGGKGPNQNGMVTVASATRHHMRQVSSANAIMERALAGDTAIMGNVNLTTLTPQQQLTTNRSAFTGDRVPVWYDWTLQDISYQLDANGNVIQVNGQPLARVERNFVTEATLNVYQGQNDANPLLTLPTFIFRNNTGGNTGALNRLGVMVVLDISASMAFANEDPTANPSAQHVPPLLQVSTNPDRFLASPYLRFRHAGGQLALNATQNDQLDLVVLQEFQNPGTVFDDMYLPGQNGSAVRFNDCQELTQFPGHNGFSLALRSPASVDTTQEVISYNVANSQFELLTPSEAATQLGTPVRELCRVNHSSYNADPIQMSNRHLSRIEAARSALLNFMLRLESTPILTSLTRVGLMTFATQSQSDNSSFVTVRSALEDATNGRYLNLRQQLIRINREGPGGIYLAGGTPIYDALNRAAQELYNDTSLNQRLIILITDGQPQPNSGNNTPAGIRALARQLGAGTYPGANNQPTTLYTVGLIGANVPFLDSLIVENEAPGRVDGESFAAASVAETFSIIDRVAFATIRQAYLTNTCRYGINVPTCVN